MFADGFFRIFGRLQFLGFLDYFSSWDFRFLGISAGLLSKDGTCAEPVDFPDGKEEDDDEDNDEEDDVEELEEEEGTSKVDG